STVAAVANPAGPGRPGSATVGSGGSATPPPPPATPPMSPLATAIDDFDRRLAPIWKLRGKERFTTLCAVVKVLIDRSFALSRMANAATDWQPTAEGLAMAVRMAHKCCVEQPKGLSKAAQDVQDANNAECIKDVHDDFVEVAKLVPGAPAVDAHANDPLIKE